MRSVNTFAVFMMYKFDYKENKNLANLLPVIDEVYVKSVNSADEATKISKNQQKITQKHPGKKLPAFDNTLRTLWGEWYIPMKTFLNQIEKFKKKLPSFYQSKGIGFGVPLEQASGEFIAQWKAKQFPAKTLVSLTGGLGVDDWAWGNSGCKVDSFDPNDSLNFWSCLNFHRLGIQDNIARYTQTAEWAMENWTQWQRESSVDIIYIDPDRRPTTTNLNPANRIIADVNLYSPNIFELYHNYRKRANYWLIKLSPMVDVHWFQTQIGVSIQAFSVCSGKEVKEILVVLPGIQNLDIHGSINKQMVWISETTVETFSSLWESMDTKLKKAPETSMPAITNNSNISINTSPPQFIFEPHAGLFALGLNRNFASIASVQTLGNYSFFLTDFMPPRWLGRTLIIETIFSGSLREIGRKLKENNQLKITITARNCGIKTLDLVKQLGTIENHERHGFIYKDESGFTLFVGTI
jgi:hypothetical protein